MLRVSIGKVLLSAATFRGQLLPFHGMLCLLKIFSVNKWQSCSHRLILQMQEICHRDLKLENTLLDGSPTPRVKICDFGYSKVLIVTCMFPSLSRNWHSCFLTDRVGYCGFSVCFAAFEAKINSWYSGIHSAGSSFKKRI